MDDLISRQAAIDTVVAWTVEDRPDIEMPTDLIGRIKALPSAQPDLDSAYTEGYTQAEAKYRKMWDEMQANIKAKAFGKRKGLVHTADIDAMPTIEERKTGKWEHLGGDEWCCNQCGNVISTEGSWEHPLSDERKMYHCNICGARMVQEGEDNG